MASPILNRAITLIASAVILTIGLMVFRSTAPAEANGNYASATGQSCGVCHVDTGGGGPLTTKGSQFAAISTHRTDPAGAWAQISTPTATATTVPPTATTVPPTATTVLPTATTVPPTSTTVPATATTVPPTATTVPATATTIPPTAVPPTAVPTISARHDDDEDDAEDEHEDEHENARSGGHDEKADSKWNLKGLAKERRHRDD